MSGRTAFPTPSLPLDSGKPRRPPESCRKEIVSVRYPPALDELESANVKCSCLFPKNQLR